MKCNFCSRWIVFIIIFKSIEFLVVFQTLATEHLFQVQKVSVSRYTSAVVGYHFSTCVWRLLVFLWFRWRWVSQVHWLFCCYGSDPTTLVYYLLLFILCAPQLVLNLWYLRFFVLHKFVYVWCFCRSTFRYALTWFSIEFRGRVCVCDRVECTIGRNGLL